jgi:hypothetical protein
VRRSLLASLLLLSALPAASASADVSLQRVGDFVEPVHVSGAPGDSERLYVVEQRGTIQVVRNGVASQFADLTAEVRGTGDPGAGGEEGLLSIAFAPEFQTSRLLYVYYTQADGQANRIDELRAPTGDAVDPASRRTVLAIPHTTANNHNGGQIAFGPDGLLYAAPGDGGSTPNAARDETSLLGKLLRIDPRGSAPGQYTVPADNPFVGVPGARGEIWGEGLRNPFRFSFDRATGDLVLGDVGQGTTEEINFLANAAGRGRGADFGWDECEGSFVTGSTTTPCNQPGTVLPVLNKFQTEGYQSIIPGYVVRDLSLPSLHGRLVYGDYFVDRPRSALVSSTGASDDREIGPQVTISGLSGFGQDAGGCLYVASRLGPVHRLVENDARIPCAAATATPIAGGPGADRREPGLRARAQRRQRVLKLRGAVAYVRCDERCRVSAGGRLLIGERRYELRRVRTGSLRAARVARVKPRLTRRGARALRRALREGRHPQVRLGVRARDAAGNRSRLARLTVYVKSR